MDQPPAEAGPSPGARGHAGTIRGQTIRLRGKRPICTRGRRPNGTIRPYMPPSSRETSHPGGHAGTIRAQTIRLKGKRPICTRGRPPNGTIRPYMTPSSRETSHPGGHAGTIRAQTIRLKGKRPIWKRRAGRFTRTWRLQPRSVSQARSETVNTPYPITSASASCTACETSSSGRLPSTRITRSPGTSVSARAYRAASSRCSSVSS